MKPQIDKNLEKIYLKILIDKLQKPENWVRRSTYKDQYISSYVNIHHQVYFVTKGIWVLNKKICWYNTKKVSICHSDACYYVCDLNLTFNFKVRWLIRKLHKYMTFQTDSKKIEEIDKRLKDALPENIDRYLKLIKIMNKKRK